MKFLILLVLIPFLALAESGVSNSFKIAGNSTTSKNLVNGSFESGANTGWTVGAGTLTATTAQAIQGVDSGLWTITGAGTIDLCATPTGLASTDLLASGWVKSTSTDLQVCSVVNSVENGCTALGTITGWKKVTASATYASGNFCFRLKSVASGAITAYVDDVKLEPLEYLQTATVTTAWQDGTEWTSFTPTGSWTTNTTYTGKWKKSGGDLEAQYFISLSGAPNATTLTLNLPNGLTIDTSKIAGLSPSTVLGRAGSLRGGNGTITLPYYSTSSQVIVGFSAIGVDSAQYAPITSTTPSAWANGDCISFYIKVPIVGWSSAPTLLALPTSKENVFSAVITSAGAITSQNASWLTSITKTGTGLYTIDYTKLSLTAAPSISSMTLVNSLFVQTNGNPTTTSASIRIVSDAGTPTDSGFNLVLQKQGADYNPQGVFISNINPDGFNKTSGQVGLVESFSFSYGTTNATTVCSASPCSYLDQIGNNVTSVTRASAGVYVANFGKTFTKLKCTNSPNNNGASIVASYNNLSCANCSTLSFSSINGGAASTDSFGTILCQGY